MQRKETPVGYKKILSICRGYYRVGKGLIDFIAGREVKADEGFLCQFEADQRRVEKAR
jgi:hypothetical protein